jgi:hypothetical protein
MCLQSTFTLKSKISTLLHDLSSFCGYVFLGVECWISDNGRSFGVGNPGVQFPWTDLLAIWSDDGIEYYARLRTSEPDGMTGKTFTCDAMRKQMGWVIES